MYNKFYIFKYDKFNQLHDYFRSFTMLVTPNFVVSPLRNLLKLHSMISVTLHACPSLIMAFSLKDLSLLTKSIHALHATSVDV